MRKPAHTSYQSCLQSSIGNHFEVGWLEFIERVYYPNKRNYD